MKKIIIATAMASMLMAPSCTGKGEATAEPQAFDYNVDRFADIQVLRYSEFVGRVVVVYAVAEPYLLHICVESLEVGAFFVAVVVCVYGFQELAHVKVVAEATEIKSSDKEEKQNTEEK